MRIDEEEKTQIGEYKTSFRKRVNGMNVSLEQQIGRTGIGIECPETRRGRDIKK